MATKYRSWCYHVCWAIGTSYVQRNVFQIIFDYIARKPVFWKHYAKDLRMKYVFLVKDGRVTKLPFTTLLRLAERYAKGAVGCDLRKRRLIAEELMSKYENRALWQYSKRHQK